MIRYKFDILSALKAAGYSTTRIRREKLISESTLTDIRNGRSKPNAITINALCSLLEIQPGDLLEYVPDEQEQEPEAASARPEEPTAEDIF